MDIEQKSFLQTIVKLAWEYISLEAYFTGYKFS